ncbi:MAG: hypothetical protein ABSB42_02885 [Tepidisphaeraceae bacterium]|jgi:nitrate/TMAO reductase-like tetraheme cytochrome c subunit
MLNIKTKTKKFLVVLVFGGILAGMVLYGCTSAQNANPPTTQSVASADQPSFALFGPPPQKSGVQLWSENCSRCHNARPPEEFSGAQWEVIVHHMRLRANLSGPEAREIVKFLQASS